MSRPSISFEFFPPKSLEASFRLWDTMRVLAPLGPDFVSVTYGAGGTTRDLTHEAVETIRKSWGVRVAAHLTCVDASREETLAVAGRYRAAGVTDIVALRGDPPGGTAGFTAHPDGFASSVELVEALASQGFATHVGAYPDPHPDATGPGADIDWLKRKVEAGAASAITQFFFEADTFFRFRDACVAAGIEVPIIPGILPIQSWAGVRGFAERCGARVPEKLARDFETAVRDGREALFAIAHATALCDRLIEGGAPHLHFYTLNRPEMTRDVVRALGLAAEARLEDVA
ncbi:MAG: methylenetetrahydrofolate reductase [NAD(P)H] [Paracoccaceae bacterium]|nr:methylenetetrahydrofolate reductase [NAD(P)H] [Paracoccaceae bacterium]